MASRRKRICHECAKPLIKDEIALSKKMLGRGIEQFFCIGCLADYIECAPDDLRIKIQEFREQGCALFL